MMKEEPVITAKEALDAMQESLERRGLSFDSLSEDMKAQAVVGLIVLMETLKTQGWRISRPLKMVKGSE